MGPSSSSYDKEHPFPERPGQPECQYYMRTGDCKFGSSCRYNHPPEWITPKTSCVLSPIGLPMRPVCISLEFYYLRINYHNMMFIDYTRLKISEDRFTHTPRSFGYSFLFIVLVCIKPHNIDSAAMEMKLEISLSFSFSVSCANAMHARQLCLIFYIYIYI